MGKAARNEQRKLRATWLNNIAAAFMIGGMVGPYFKIAEFVMKAINWDDPLKVYSPEYWSLTYFFIGSVVLGFSFSHLFRGIANRELSYIED
ncbi:hypothetical protein [Tardiphaga sp. P5_C7]